MKKPSQASWSPRVSRAGFTLIELLTVIAIISILAGMALVGIPAYLNKAKETRTISNMDFIGKALAEYSARSDVTTGYPPAYGFILPEAREVPVADLTLSPDGNGLNLPDKMQVLPYTYVLGIQDTETVVQEPGWAFTYDANRDGNLSLFEFLPIGVKDVATSTYVFSDDLYLLTSPAPMANGTFDEKANQLGTGEGRPYVYVPYNSRQLAAAQRYWYAVEDPTTTNVLAGTFDTSHPALSGRMFFPPPNYDGFVLIGNGPGGTDGGLSAVDPPGTPGTDYPNEYTYHVTALRIAFLAKRDQDGDNLTDFSYIDRKLSAIYPLPDGTNGQGAFIKVSP